MVRVRLVATVCLVVLLAAMLAGCSAPAQPETLDGGLKYGYVDADNKTHGYVTGIVLNEAGEPVARAMVTILSMDGSATSDLAGRFNFTDVAKGEQRLRVEKQGYKTLQRPFTVVAGKIVEFEVVLARVEGLDGGLIDHYHDKWRGHDRYMIYEGRPDLTGPREYCGYRCSGHFIVPGEGRIVPPGTVKISVDISFEPSPMFDYESWSFRIIPPPGPSGAEYETQSWVLNGGEEHFEYDLPWSEIITDHGHASYTNWGFILLTSNAEAYNTLFPTVVDITITAHKGDLVIDPPHPRYWAETDRIEMPTGSETGAKCLLGRPVVLDCASRSPNPYVTFGSRDEPRQCFPYNSNMDNGGCMVLDRGGLVPPGTTRISFDLEISQGGTWGTAAAAPPPVDDTDWVLGFKTAAPQRGGATWDDYTWVEPVETYDPEPQEGRYHQQGLRYVIDVPRGGEDPYYTVLSGWIFMMGVQGHEQASDYSAISCSTMVCGEPYFQMNNFFVHNDSASAMELE